MKQTVIDALRRVANELETGTVSGVVLGFVRSGHESDSTMDGGIAMCGSGQECLGIIDAITTQLMDLADQQEPTGELN